MSDMKISTTPIDMPAAKMPKFNTDSKEKLEKAAKDFEGMFMDIVMKSMRDTVGESNVFGDSKQTQFFQSMLDSEYAKDMGGHGKIGLSAAIVRQLSPKIAKVEADAETKAEKI